MWEDFCASAPTLALETRAAHMEPLMRASEFERVSGDSWLRRLSFDGERIEVLLQSSELDMDVLIRVKTQVLRSKFKPNGPQGDPPCFLRTTRLEMTLGIENGHYVPAGSFAGMMKEVRSGLALAYGLSATSHNLLLELVGPDQLLVCVVENEGSVVVTRAP